MRKLLMISLLAILAGCYYDNEEELYPDGTSDCDTTNVTYTGTIGPIISSNCTGCHSGSAPQGNIHLDDYASISAAALIPAGQPGSLYGAVSHHPDNSPMPKNGTKLSDCKLEQIRIWIEDVAPEN